MNILVVGANGLIGKKLIKSLSLNYSNKIYAIVRDKNLPTLLTLENTTFLELDLSNFNLDILPKNIDAIFYLAQSRKFRDFPEGSEDVLAVNVIAPVKLVNWAIRNGVKKFIYASSGGVYTNPTQPVKEFFEINANEKLGFYLNSKLSAEMLLRNYASMFETFVILRPFFVYGPGQNKTMLIPRLIQNIKEGKEIILNGEEGIKLNPIFVEDAAKAIANVVKLKGEYIFNIAGNEVTTIKGLCTIIKELAGKEPIYRRVETAQNDLVADNSLMIKLLHIPKVSLREGLRTVIKEDFNE